MLDWLASCLVVAGWWAMARNWRLGLILNLGGNIVWLAWGASLGLWSIVVLNVVFVVLNVRTYREWVRRRETWVAMGFDTKEGG